MSKKNPGGVEENDGVRNISELKIFIFFVIFLSVLLTTNLIDKSLLVAIMLIAAFYVLKITHRWFFLTSFASITVTGVMLALEMPDVAHSTALIAYYLMFAGIITEIVKIN